MCPSSAERPESDPQRYEALLDLAGLVTHQREPFDVIREVAASLQTSFPIDFLTFASHNPAADTMTVHVWAGGGLPAHPQELAVEEDATGIVWQTQQIIVLDDVSQEKRFEPGLGRLREQGLRSYCVVPLTTLDRRMGALGFGLKRNCEFSPAEVEFLRRVAEIAALSLYSAQSRQSALILAIESGRAHRALKLLQEIDAHLASNFDLPQYLFAISRCIQKVIPHDHAGVGICDPDGKSMRVVALDPALNAMLVARDESIPLQHTVLTQAFLDQSTAILGPADLAALKIPLADRALENGICSLCCAPMVTANGPIGVLGLASRAEGAFTQQDLNLLIQISYAVALWMENTFTQEEARKEKDRLQALLEIDEALSQSQAEFRQAFPAISSSVGKVVPHDLAWVNVMDWVSGTLSTYAWRGRVADPFVGNDAAFPVERSLALQLLGPREGRIITAEKLPPLAAQIPALRHALENGVQSACFIPLVTSAGTIGGLCLARTGETPLAEEDLRFLRRLAPGIALALENTLAHQALTWEKTRLQALRDIDSVLASKLELEKLLPAVSGCFRRVIPHDDFSVFLYDASTPGLRIFSTDSEMTQNVVAADTVLSLDNTLMGEAFVSQKTRVYDHADLLQSRSAPAQRAIELGVRSACYVPLITRQGPLGVMILSSNSDRAFRVEGLDILDQAGISVARTLENALAHRALQQEKKNLQVVLKTGSKLAANFDPQHGFRQISAALRSVKLHEFGSLALRCPSGLFRHILDFPLGKGFLLADGAMSIKDSPVEKTLHARTSMIFARAEIAAFNSRFSSGLLQEGIKSLCCVPLLASKEILGTLNLGSTREDAFSPNDFALLIQVAAQIAAVLETGNANREIEQLKNRLSGEKQYLSGEVRTEPHFEEIIGQSSALKRVLDQVAIVASSDATVLILGETGTGKELVARAIHRLSLRKDAGFVKVNCAAIPTGLLESELFGHEKGAFTGAVNLKVGRLELADRGTLFLDEVGEIALDIQPKLLRVLQDQEFERVGGIKTIKVNLRLIAATNRDISKSIAQHEFRSDLYYRLNVFPIRMPPLRDRREDIPMLVRHFVHKYAVRMNRKIENIPADAMNALSSWHWPGNVRELENFMERSVILSEGPSLQVPLAELRSSGDDDAASSNNLDNADREHIIRVLRESGGLISGPNGAAGRLGVKRTTLQSKMQRLGIGRDDYSVSD